VKQGEVVDSSGASPVPDQNAAAQVTGCTVCLQQPITAWLDFKLHSSCLMTARCESLRQTLALLEGPFVLVYDCAM